LRKHNCESCPERASDGRGSERYGAIQGLSGLTVTGMIKNG